MPARHNQDRVRLYPPNDLLIGIHKDRVAEVLSNWTEENIVGINEAIEVHQCKKTIEHYPDLFDPKILDRLRSSATRLISAAVRIAGMLIGTRSLDSLYEEVEFQYVDRFWGFIAEFGLWRQIPDTDLYELMQRHPGQIANILGNPILVKGFDETIARSMHDNHIMAAETIIGSFASESRNPRSLKLPTSLTNEMIDEIMLAYLSESMPNLNHVRVLASWPSSARISYRPSAEVLVRAKKKEEELNDSLFPDHTAGLEYGFQVAFSPSQKACKRIDMAESSYTITFGMEWLSTYTDPGTILNNFIYIFEFADRGGLLNVPARKHERNTLAEVIGLHTLDEYPTSIAFDMRNSQVWVEVLGYRNLLKGCDCRLEAALEWFYNEYAESEFGIEGFNISLPTEETSYLDKCKSIGPEIERVLKSFKLYVERGAIDESYFPHVEIKDFDTIPSLIEKKYLVESSGFAKRGGILFSDQSWLAYSEAHPDARCNFFSMISEERVHRDDFPDIYQPCIDWVASDGLVEIREDGMIEPSAKSKFLHYIWNKGAIPLFHCSDSDKQMGDRLSEDGIARYSDTLFSPDESDYMNFMFNNAKFSNAVALRNKYDHASGRIDDPNDQAVEEDYSRLLVLLIGLTLKINEEIRFHLGKGGPEDFIDWPLIDKGNME